IFSVPGHLNVNQFLPLKFIACNDNNLKVQGNNCDTTEKGTAASYRVKFTESASDASLNDSLASSCINETGPASSLTSAAFVIPVNAPNFVIETYAATNCTGL